VRAGAALIIGADEMPRLVPRSMRRAGVGGLIMPELKHFLDLDQIARPN